MCYSYSECGTLSWFRVSTGHQQWINYCRWTSPQYSDIIMSAIASHITSISSVCSAICSGTHQRKHQSSAWLSFMRGVQWWLVDSPHKGPVIWEMFPFDDVIMCFPWRMPSSAWTISVLKNYRKCKYIFISLEKKSALKGYHPYLNGDCEMVLVCYHQIWCLRNKRKCKCIFMSLEKFSFERLLPIFSWGLWNGACMFTPNLRLVAPYQPIISPWSRSIDEYYKNSLAKELLGYWGCSCFWNIGIEI